MVLRSAAIGTAVVITLLCAGCDRKSEAQNFNSTAMGQVSAAEPAEELVADIYPGATDVRLFVREEFNKVNDGSGFLKPRGTLLTDQQRKQFEAALLKEPMPEEMAACFIPHHFFRFYDAKGKELGEVAVCFCCIGVQATGESNIDLGSDQILGMELAKMKKLVVTLGAPTDINCD